jgi:hypothetical protein
VPGDRIQLDQTAHVLNQLSKIFIDRQVAVSGHKGHHSLQNMRRVGRCYLGQLVQHQPEQIRARSLGSDHEYRHHMSALLLTSLMFAFFRISKLTTT